MSRDPQQRGRKERFIVIPFSSTCRSASSVDVVHSNNKPQPQGAGGGGGGEVTSAAPAMGKPGKTETLSLVARLLRGFKNLSHQIFAVHDEEDDEDEEEQEMVIGLPTDVKHVAHIGWDGSTSTTASLRSWNRAAPPPTDATASTSSSSSAAAPAPLAPQAQEPAALSARQLELAMAAQASAAGTGAAPAATAASTSGASSSGAARRHRHYS